MNNFITTSDGVPICFDVFEPREGAAIERNALKRAVILGHGVMVNKEALRLIAIEVAKAGLVAVAFDFRSHGQSGGDFLPAAQPIVDSIFDKGESSELPVGQESGELPFELEFLKADIDAIKQYLASRGDIDMHNLGYLGYSMGGGAGFTKLADDSDFIAMVGLAPAVNLKYVDAGRPRNLLLLIGLLDEAIPVHSMYNVMEKRTGIPASELASNQLYGEFSAGTATKLIEDPFGEHYLAPYNPLFIREAVNWFRLALLDSEPNETEFIHPWLCVFFLLQAIGGIGLFFIVASYIISKYSTKKEPTVLLAIHEKPIKTNMAYLYIILFSHILMVVAIPLYATPMLIAGFECMLMLGPSMAAWFFIRHVYKEQGVSVLQIYRNLFQTTSRTNLTIGLGLGLLLYFVLWASFGNIMGIWPGWYRVAWAPLFMIVCVFIFSNFIFVFQIIRQEQAERCRKPPSSLFRLGLENYALNMAITIYVLGLPSVIIDFYFLMMFPIPLAVIMGLVSFIATYSYRKTKDILIPTIISAIFVAMFYLSMSLVIPLYRFVL
jgi:dienelactone hydrolase